MPEEVSIPKPKRKLGALSYLMIIAAVVVLLIAASYGLWHSAASSKRSAALEKARERGEPIWFSEIEPKPVDPSQDGGPLYLAAMSKAVGQDEKFYAVHAAATGEPGTSGMVAEVSRTVAAGPGDHPEFRQAIEANAEALALLREAMAKPYCRIQRDYTTKQPFMILLEDVQQARDLGRVLQADVLQSLGTGRPERAVEAIEEMFGLAECLREEPFLVSQLVRIAVGELAIASIETLLEHGDLTDEQFARLDARLKAIEAGFRLKNSMLAERSSVMTTIEHLAEQDDQELRGGMGFLAVRPLVLEEQAFLLDLMGRMAENIDQPGPAGVQAAQELDDTLTNAPSRFVHVNLMVPAVQMARTAGLRYRQHLINARLGLRVHRYHAANGKLPEKLDDALDAGLSQLPVGLFSGKPPVYRTTGNGFMIYALGSNGTDDGGSMQPDREEGGTLFHVDYGAAGQPGKNAEP